MSKCFPFHNVRSTILDKAKPGALREVARAARGLAPGVCPGELGPPGSVGSSGISWAEEELRWNVCADSGDRGHPRNHGMLGSQQQGQDVTRLL